MFLNLPCRCCRLCDQCQRTNHLKSGSKNLDFHLANHRGKSIRVTLWGSLRDVLIEKKNQTDWCVPNKVYLSSTSSTVIYDDDAIPVIKALKKKIVLSISRPMECLHRLEFDVSNNTAQAVVVMFNETATALVNCSVDSLMDTIDESSEDHLSLSPTLSNLIGTAHVMEIKSHT
ncbi:hypothetical protein Tco_1529380 [Tanacetum coccineum]